MQARPPEAPHCPSGEVTHCPSAHPRTEWLLGHRACGFKTRTSGSPSTQGGTGHTASPVGVHGWCLHRRGTAEGDQRSWGGGGWHCFCPCLESRILPTKDSLALWRKTSLGPNCPRAARAGAQDRGGGGISAWRPCFRMGMFSFAPGPAFWFQVSLGESRQGRGTVVLESAGALHTLPRGLGREGASQGGKAEAPKIPKLNARVAQLHQAPDAQGSSGRRAPPTTAGRAPGAPGPSPLSSYRFKSSPFNELISDLSSLIF